LQLPVEKLESTFAQLKVDTPATLDKVVSTQKCAEEIEDIEV
jgi:hypothetical protein